VVEKIPVTGSPGNGSGLSDFEEALVNRIRIEFPHGVDMGELFVKTRKFRENLGQGDMSIQEFQTVILKLTPNRIKINIRIHANPILNATAEEIPTAE